ncbi:conserved hypothetical protein [Rhodopseudomonas palustris HaA2]|uniref:Cytochrome c domain-containing protein n=1 Tax=Rhodopseudomonas palustris (strain HaA2) TaxID=316058 RepID=Q2IY90_RHOP2|nr:hypothetical protein [Rhodopseudomonas palustris]ABD06820.1 conserved hypothetical protein [Rhodopseudomonas palustris HaA2]
MKRFAVFAVSVMFVNSISAAVAAGDKACQVGKLAEWQRNVVIAGTDRAIFIEKNKLKAGEKAEDFDFSFGATIGQILRSANQSDSKANRVAVVKSLIDSFKLTKAPHPLGSREVAISPRLKESSIDPAKLLDESSPEGLHPIGLFNRFDQAPEDWQYCGEHRIVFAQGQRGADGLLTGPLGTLNRFFLIFEAAVANPRPDLQKEGCRPAADLWLGLKQLGTDTHKVAERLHRFYFKGLSAPNGVVIPPVIHARHYGNPFGQVRGNTFKQLPWELREWHVELSTGKFLPAPVGTNPQPAFYTPPETNVSGIDPAVKKAFQEVFVKRVVADAVASNQGLADRPADEQQTHLVNRNGVRGNLIAAFNDFVSDAGPPPRNDDPNQSENRTGAFREAVKNKIDELKPPTAGGSASGVSIDEVMNRVGATSCGGCHQFSAKQPANPADQIGTSSDNKPIVWPRSLGFVHIDETSRLSPLLTDFFLADRCENLNELFGKPAPPFDELAARTLFLTERTKLPTEILQEFAKTVPNLNQNQVRALNSATSQLNRDARQDDRARLGASGRIRQAD